MFISSTARIHDVVKARASQLTWTLLLISFTTSLINSILSSIICSVGAHLGAGGLDHFEQCSRHFLAVDHLAPAEKPVPRVLGIGLGHVVNLHVGRVPVEVRGKGLKVEEERKIDEKRE